MKRNKKILIVCHCLLNVNTKVYPLAGVGGAFSDILTPYAESGVGFFQLPCPEISYLGMKRWGMTKEQYDTLNFRKHCRDILKYPIIQLKALTEDGCEFVGILGMDGSPNCGVFQTCAGYRGGEISISDNLEEQLKALRFVSGQGVFMEELSDLLKEAGIHPKYLAVKE